MEEKKSGYGRFWRAFARLDVGAADREEIRRDLVLQYSCGRTDSLRELTNGEYLHLCECVEELCGARSALRRARSQVLHQLQRMGVDTSDWSRVDALCEDRRIAGKRFAHLYTDELQHLRRKLIAIERRGGFSRRVEDASSGRVMIMPYPVDVNPS